MILSLMSYQNGEIEERLAISCEAVKGNSQWQLTLRKDLRWSDGKPITLEEVIEAFSASRIAPIITAIKPDGKTQLHIRLSQEEALFPFWLRYICPLPSHSTQPYRVTSGAYQLKRFRPDTMTLYFEQNPDYYRGEDTCIDWLTVKRFTRPANAVKAIEDGTIDLLYLYIHALQPLYQFSTTAPCQQWPFFQDNYYALLLNRHCGLFSDKRNCSLLKQSIDYRAINFYLRVGEGVEEPEIVQSSQPLDIRVACSRVDDAGGRDVKLPGSSHWTISGFHCGESYLCQRRDAGRGGCLFNSTLFWFGVQPPVTILPFRWDVQLFWTHQSSS